MVRLYNICFEGISEGEYLNRRNWLGFGSFTKSGNIFARIINPVIFEVNNSEEESRIKSYHDSVLELLHHPIVSSVGVNKSGTWIRANKAGSGYSISCIDQEYVRDMKPIGGWR